MTLIDTATAAKHLRLSERTVRRLVADGHVPNRGTPRRIRVTLLEVSNALSRRAIKKGLGTKPG